MQLALKNLTEPLPPKVQEVLQSTYLSKLKEQSLEECNEQYLASHKDSAPHVQSVVRFRRVLDPDGKEETKSVQNLQDTLELDSISLEAAEAGMRLLDEIEAGAEAKKAYLDSARERFPAATMFQQS